MPILWSPHESAGHDVASRAAAVSRDLRDGPKGALLISAIAVGLLFVGWLAFYFLLFMPRGPIG